MIHRSLRTEDEEIDVPEEMECILDDLFRAIQDKVNTIDFRLKQIHSEQLSRILLFGGQQRKASAEFPRDFPHTFLGKYWRLS